MQETYLRVLAKPRLLRNDDDFGYLLRALRNTFLVGKRTRAPPAAHGAVPGATASLAPREPEPGARGARGVRGDRRAARRLPRRARRRRRRGLSYGETARALRLADGTVMSRLYRARQQVARALAPAAT